MDEALHQCLLKCGVSPGSIVFSINQADKAEPSLEWELDARRPVADTDNLPKCNHLTAVLLTLSGACGVGENRLQPGPSGRNHDFALSPKASGSVMTTGIITVQPGEAALFKRDEKTRIR